MKIGFIGLGHMGTGMATNLLKAGHDLTVYNRTPDKAQALVKEKGASPSAYVMDELKTSDVRVAIHQDYGMLPEQSGEWVRDTKSELIDHIAEKLHLAKARAEQIVDAIFDSMVTALKAVWGEFRQPAVF